MESFSKNNYDGKGETDLEVLIRTDASFEIGTGHVMRCLTLANILSEYGAAVSFICRELPGNMCCFIENKGYIVYRLKQNKREEIEQITPHSHWLTVNWETDVLETIHLLKSQNKFDWLIIDHYALDEKWETKIKPFTKKIMVIDDLADRRHECDILLDQNYYFNKEFRYESLVPKHCKRYLGPEYTLLRHEFIMQDRKIHSGSIKRLLIYFGGTDSTNETKKAIESLLLLKKNDIKVDVIVGKNNRFYKDIQTLCKQYSFLNYHLNVSNMANLVNAADLAIGACGTTTWERLYLGLPTIVVSVAENQKLIAETLGEINVIKYLGTNDSVKKKDIALALKNFVQNPAILIEMSESCLKIMGEHELLQKSLINEIINGVE